MKKIGNICFQEELKGFTTKKSCIVQIQNFGNEKLGVATGSQHPLSVKEGVTSVRNTLIGRNKAPSGFGKFGKICSQEELKGFSQQRKAHNVGFGSHIRVLIFEGLLLKLQVTK